jgi:parvulin-like peptidyl-prolyl isomerase
MRQFLFSIIVLFLFLTACSNADREEAITSQEGVRLYAAMQDESEYTEKEFTGDDAALYADILKTECPQGVPAEFVRTEIKGDASSLVIYSDLSGENITCSVLKPGAQKTIVLKTPADAPLNTTAVVVNGETVTIAQVQAAMAALPESSPRDLSALNLVVNQLINDELLRQEAAKVEATEKDREAARSQLAPDLSDEELAKALADRGIERADFDAEIEAQARLRALFRIRLLSDEIDVSEDAVQEYYLANPNQFLQSEQAVMRHIFIKAEGRSAQEGRERAQMVANRMKGQDFCELVKEFSDDPQNKENCGVYVVPRGVLNPDLEAASFGTPVNQTSVVTTEQGIHLVQTLQVVPTQVVPYQQVAGTLQSSLYTTVLQQRLNLYLQLLRVDADIVSYLG